MSLKHAIVGLLLERPMHGYELKRVLSPALSRADQMNDGVLYPLLARLQREGLVSRRVVAGARRPARHVIHSTKKCERAFIAWLESDAGESDEVAYDFLIARPFLAKYMFFDRLQPDLARRKLEGQLASARVKLDAFAAIRRGMVRRRVARHQLAILDLGITHQRQTIRWLERLVAGPRRRPRRKERHQ
jgi:DNA-binding PadR family transcriptional regulator